MSFPNPTLIVFQYLLMIIETRIPQLFKLGRCFISIQISDLRIRVQPDNLRSHQVAECDVFYLPFHFHRFDRKGPDGKGRELHTELAKDAIDYTLYPDYRTHYKAHTNATVELAACKYFTTNLLDVDTIMVRDFSELDSFVVYICMEGKASIRDNKGNEIYIHQGQTVLIPADTDVVTISPVPGAKFMETYIG